MTNVCVSIYIEQPVEKVFDYITTASNWPKWHPATLSVSGAVFHPALEGETIVEKIKFGIARDRFTWKVVERRPPNRWVISGTSDNRQKVRIAYNLSAIDNGTLWKGEMRFDIPKSLELLERLLFSRLVRRNSETAVRQLKELMESY